MDTLGTPSGYPRDRVLPSLLVAWTRNSGSVLGSNFCNSFFFSGGLAVVRVIGVSAIRALTVLIFFPPFPKCYFNSVYTGRPSSNWRRADIWGAGGFKNYCTSKGREWNQSGIWLWCKRIVNSYSDFDSEEKKSGFNLSAQLPWERD